MVQSGTSSKGDVLVCLELSDCDAIELEITSKVLLKYGDSIRQSILETLAEIGIKSAKIKVDDNGALDFVIRARVETAAKRALGDIR